MLSSSTSSTLFMRLTWTHTVGSGVVGPLNVIIPFVKGMTLVLWRLHTRIMACISSVVPGRMIQAGILLGSFACFLSAPPRVNREFAVTFYNSPVLLRYIPLRRCLPELYILQGVVCLGYFFFDLFFSHFYSFFRKDFFNVKKVGSLQVYRYNKFYQSIKKDTLTSVICQGKWNYKRGLNGFIKRILIADIFLSTCWSGVCRDDRTWVRSHVACIWKIKLVGRCW